MKILIELDLEDVDFPSYTHRVTDALVQLTRASLGRSIKGKYEFVGEQNDFLVGHKFKTAVSVFLVPTPDKD